MHTNDDDEEICASCASLVELTRKMPGNLFASSYEFAATIEHSFSMPLDETHHNYLRDLMLGPTSAMIRWMKATGILVSADCTHGKLRRVCLSSDPCSFIVDSLQDVGFVVAVPVFDAHFGLFWQRTKWMLDVVDDASLREALQTARNHQLHSKTLALSAVPPVRLTPDSCVILLDGSTWIPVVKYTEYPVFVTPAGRIRYTCLPQSFRRAIVSSATPLELKDDATAKRVTERQDMLNLPKLDLCNLTITEKKGGEDFEVVEKSEGVLPSAVQRCALCMSSVEGAIFVPPPPGALPFLVA